MLRFITSKKDLSRLKADVAACFAYEGESKPLGVQENGLRRELAAEMKAERFEGRRGDLLVWNADGRFGSRRFFVVGLGTKSTATARVLGEGCAVAVRAAEKLSAKSLALRLPPVSGEQANGLARSATEGVLLGAYRFERYLNDDTRRRAQVKSVELSVDGPLGVVGRAVALGKVVARAVHLARDLVNEPPSVMTPSEMVRRARREAKRSGISVKVLGPRELTRLGAHALLAVARGSNQPAQVVHLSYSPPKGKAKKNGGKVVLVGKGVTFDSGGLNLKPGNSMLTMKGDMAGAAAVLATMTALPEMGCRVRVEGLLGLVENMTGSAAFKPGDILNTLSGKTVEVGNTDAEGRLVLCDLLAHAARRFKPDRMVDIATLTGACVIALGPLCTGIFSRHEDLGLQIFEAGRRAGEKLWMMPMYEEYLDSLREGPADLKNVGDRWGGAITAALFLGEFVPEDLPWVHLDIAGPAFNEKDTPEAPAGGTGAGVRTLIRWLEGV